MNELEKNFVEYFMKSLNPNNEELTEKELFISALEIACEGINQLEMYDQIQCIEQLKASQDGLFTMAFLIHNPSTMKWEVNLNLVNQHFK